MESPLVVGVDGSESSLRAVDWATDEAAARGVPLRLLQASLWEQYEGRRPYLSAGRPAEKVMAEHIVACCAECVRLRNPDVKVSGEVVPDDAVTALLREGREAFALVTGDLGRGGLAGRLLGSVGLAVAARAACPVIVVRGGERNRTGAFGRVVLGVDAQNETAAAVRFAFAEAEARKCTLNAVQAWRCPVFESEDMVVDAAREHRERASLLLSKALNRAMPDGRGVQVRRQVVEGPAHRILLEASADADLLVVGAPRRDGRRGLQLGRVGHALLHHSACPVAVVPQTP
ncbi:universal stress protein [Streptomyces sp. NPDC051776]|uniref:universal stress protein n=1 Tax=Streptomyces sp. NPDC051776 TaxID=3155414 RepID=UPI003443094C